MCSLLTKLVSELGVTSFVEVNFSNALLIAQLLDVLAEFFAHFLSVLDGIENGLGVGAVGSFEGHVTEAEEPQPKGAQNTGVLHPVELDLIDVLIQDALNDFQALVGDLKSLAAHDKPLPPSHQNKHRGPQRNGPVEIRTNYQTRDAQKHAGGEDREVHDLRWPTFPNCRFVVVAHGSIIRIIEANFKSSRKEAPSSLN